MKQGKEGYGSSIDFDWLPEQDVDNVDFEQLRPVDMQAPQPRTSSSEESLGLNLCDTRSLRTPEQQSRANTDLTVLHQQNAPRGPDYDHKQIN